MLLAKAGFGHRELREWPVWGKQKVCKGTEGSASPGFTH